MNYAILLAGGTGTRIDTEVPKQYVRAAGRMMATHSLSALLCCPQIDAIYIVAERAWREPLLEDMKKSGLDTAKFKGFSVPGSNRQQSIVSGMQSILADADEKMRLEALVRSDTVLVHDAARPFLTGELLAAIYQALPGHDGVMPVLAMKDTVYKSDDGRQVSGLLKRSSIYAGQAPELFLLRPYYAANMALTPDEILKINGATEPAVMAAMDVVMIPGQESNFKITSDGDLEKYREIMKGRQGIA